MFTFKNLSATMLLASVLFAGSLLGADDTVDIFGRPTTDYVVMKDNKMLAVIDGMSSAMNGEMLLKNGAKVESDGSIVMPDGTKSKLTNGDWMTADGKTNGRIKIDGHPKADRLVMKDGKMLIMKNNQAMPMEFDMEMLNGTKVMTDGTVIKDGKKATLKNDDWIMIDGDSNAFPKPAATAVPK